MKIFIFKSGVKSQNLENNQKNKGFWSRFLQFFGFNKKKRAKEQKQTLEKNNSEEKHEAKHATIAKKKLNPYEIFYDAQEKPQESGTKYNLSSFLDRIRCTWVTKTRIIGYCKIKGMEQKINAKIDNTFNRLTEKDQTFLLDGVLKKMDVLKLFGTGKNNRIQLKDTQKTYGEIIKALEFLANKNVTKDEAVKILDFCFKDQGAKEFSDLISDLRASYGGKTEMKAFDQKHDIHVNENANTAKKGALQKNQNEQTTAPEIVKGNSLPDAQVRSMSVNSDNNSYKVSYNAPKEPQEKGVQYDVHSLLDKLQYSWLDKNIALGFYNVSTKVKQKTDFIIENIYNKLSKAEQDVLFDKVLKEISKSKLFDTEKNEKSADIEKNDRIKLNDNQIIQIVKFVTKDHIDQNSAVEITRFCLKSPDEKQFRNLISGLAISDEAKEQMKALLTMGMPIGERKNYSSFSQLSRFQQKKGPLGKESIKSLVSPFK